MSHENPSIQTAPDVDEGIVAGVRRASSFVGDNREDSCDAEVVGLISGTTVQRHEHDEVPQAAGNPNFMYLIAEGSAIKSLYTGHAGLS